MRVHRSITLDRVLELANQREFNLDNPGICLACGEEAYGCEPDACKYMCESCGKHEVYGVEEIAMMGAYHEGSE